MNRLVQSHKKRFPIGCQVVSQAGWTGLIVGINDNNPSAPLRVQWDKNGRISSANSGTVKRANVGTGPGAGTTTKGDEQARRIACERGESTDCPDQHLCRHGIDN
jgi:hypothetical protein